MKRYSTGCYSPMLSKERLAISITLLSTGLIFACSTALYIPSQNMETPNARVDELQDGRASYINKCGGCHSLVVPEKHTAKEWKKWVDRMEPKAKITQIEKENILKYLSKGEK